MEQPHHSIKPKLQKYVYPRTFKYDLQEIMRSLSEIHDYVIPRKSNFILNTNKGSIISVSAPGRGILDLCDGENTLETIIE